MKQKTDEEILAEINKILKKYSVLKNYRYDREKKKLVLIKGGKEA